MKVNTIRGQKGVHYTERIRRHFEKKGNVAVSFISLETNGKTNCKVTYFFDGTFEVKIKDGQMYVVRYDNFRDWISSFTPHEVRLKELIIGDLEINEITIKEDM